jgi:curli production assembly/transport component CsgF
MPKRRFPGLKFTLQAAACVLALAATPAPGTEMVYVPVNPSFGGSPLNGPVLLNAAQAQNKHKDPDAQITGLAQRTPLEQFNETLQRAILSRVAAAATGSLFNASGQLVPGTVETADFSISIVDQGGGVLQITTTDKATGQSTSFQVGL